MKRQIIASAAAIALFVACDAGGMAVAQDAGGGTSTTPPAGQTTAPSGQTTTPPAGQATTAPGQKLPEVQVIQEQPKAKPKPVKHKPKPKAKPAPVVAQTAPPPQPPLAEQAVIPPAPDEVKMSPVGGSEIPVAKVPGAVSQVTAADIASTGSVVPQDYLAQHVPGITVGDLQGNGFQTDIQYRGFEASPVNGVAQGIAVYQNGVRINEAFGDVVNLDFLPEMAIRSVTVMSGNPVFGLNALGGSINFNMQDGFNYHGAEIDIRAGSFGRIQESATAGMQSGSVAAFIALENIDDDGWREFSPTDIKRMYADLGFKGDGSEFHINFTGADNSYGVTAAAPVQLLDTGWDRAFTSPQITDNQVEMVSVNGIVKVTPSTTVSGVAYYRHFKQTHIDGNIAEFDRCTLPANAGLLCDDPGPTEEVLEDVGGANIGDPDPTKELGSIDSTSQDANSFGGSLQAVNKDRLFGYRNQFLIGASYDHGHVLYHSQSEVGTFGPHFVVDGTGTIIGGDDDGPRNITTINDYVGVYFTDTIDLTSRLSTTVGGRWNFARIELQDQDDPTSTELNATHDYQRFNPAAGLTYKLLPGMSLYAGYSEANRAPTPGELACADPTDPCLIESFLTSDPALKQVVSHTWEAGLRGDYGSPINHFEWTLGFFRTLNTDDIVTQIANDGTRGFFINAADTLRQGIEASAQYTTDRYRLYASYNYTDATYASPWEAFSPNHQPAPGPCNDPTIPDDVCLQVHSGDHIPGIPAHKFKAGFDYWITHQWKFGADLIATSSQYLYGDENNTGPKLAGYAKVNLHTSYDLTKNIQIYGLIDNLFNAHFGTYGTFFDTDEASDVSDPHIDFTNAKTITPSMPFAAYGGVKFHF